MTHSKSLTFMTAAAVAICLGFPAAATAGPPQSFHCSGWGVFGPTNIGTPQGGNFDVIIGDGSGLAPYLAAGDADDGTDSIPDGDFTIDGVRVGATGFNAHEGEVFSRTTGVLKQETGVVRWPARSSVNHVLSSDDGEIHFRYTGGFELDLAAFAAGEPSFSGEALFIIVGGTGRFAGSAGIVWVEVHVPFALPGLPPPGVSPDIPFVYDFNGFIVLDE